jgi:hypothetical protein
VFSAAFIDFGYCFNGPQWETLSPDLCGLYHSADAYQDLYSSADFEPWLGMVLAMPRDLLAEAAQSMPAEWLATSDRPLLSALLKNIYSSRHALPALLESLCNRRSTYFSNWHSPQEHPITAAHAA